MKVLVISHNVFSKTESMGKTLSGYFGNFKASDIAQLYFHSEVPTMDLCENYYRVTDKDMIKSIFTFKSGRIFSKDDINYNLTNSRTDTGMTAKLYQKARKRTPFIYFCRNLIWKLGHWFNKKLKNWIDDFNPDIVFFASGDYAFSYKIALKIAKYRNIPLITSCMDDYYFNNANKHHIFGKIVHKSFMKQVIKTISYSSALMCICDKMSVDYEKYFNKKCYTLHTPASFNEQLSMDKSGDISYIGNLGYNRHLQLVKIGRALKELNLPDAPHFVTVYSSEARPEILSYLTMDNGIDFKGQISAEEVKKVMGESLAVIHTESFDEEIVNSVKYSVSTKIADSIMSGTCLFAFGPENIASIEYLRKNSSAIIATSDEELKEKLQLLVSDSNYRETAEKNGVNLAKKNHNPDMVYDFVFNVFKECLH